MCEAIIKNINLLIDTIDKNRKTSLSRDLDYLYKHCLFAVIRVRDNKDFDFLDGCVKVLSDITEGWERVDLSIKNQDILAYIDNLKEEIDILNKYINNMMKNTHAIIKS